MSKRNQQTDYAAELEKEYARWDELFTNGGSDPFWSDGINLELVKNHIHYYKSQLEKQGDSLFGLPDIYYRKLPPDVDPNSTGCRTVSPKGAARMPRQQSETGYMARPDEIRDNARKAMETIDADENLKFVREQAPSLSEAQYKQFCIAAIVNYAENLRRAIAEDDLVIMRRYENPERYLESFESAAARIRDPECTRRINDNLTVCAPEIDEDFEEENSEIVQSEGIQLTLF